jgi:hypothetical protein
MIGDTSRVAKRWQFVVDQTFAIKNRGLIAVGDLDGSVSMGEPAELHAHGDVIRLDRVGLDMICRTPRVALVFTGVSQDDVPPGAVIASVD